MSESTPAAAPAPAAPEASTAPIADTATEASDEADIEAEAAQLTKEEAKAIKKRYELKVNNKVKNIDIDLSNDEEVKRYLQKAEGADEKFQEAASLRKQVEQLVTELKKNPLAILRHPELGIDVKALAQQVLNEEIEDMKLSPQEKRIKELEDSLKAKETREKELEEERTANERAKFEAQAAEDLDEQVTSALSKSNLPKSPYVLRRISDVMIAAMDMGYNDVKVDDIMPFVQEQINGEIQRLFDEAPEDTFEKVMEGIVGKKHLDKYRKNKISKSKSKASTTSAAQIKDTGASSKTEKKPEPAKPVRFKDLYGV
jgi:hypothetical protein